MAGRREADLCELVDIVHRGCRSPKVNSEVQVSVGIALLCAGLVAGSQTGVRGIFTAYVGESKSIASFVGKFGEGLNTNYSAANRWRPLLIAALEQTRSSSSGCSW